MKTNIDPTLEPGTALIEMDWPGQSRPFTITGDVEVLTPYAEALQAEAKAIPVHFAATVIKAAQEAPQYVLEGRKATLQAKLYDMVNHTNMYELLKQKRADERNLAFATRLGLISLEDVSCRKHEKAISKLHGL